MQMERCAHCLYNGYEDVVSLVFYSPNQQKRSFVLANIIRTLKSLKLYVRILVQTSCMDTYNWVRNATTERWKTHLHLYCHSYQKYEGCLFNNFGRLPCDYRATKLQYLQPVLYTYSQCLYFRYGLRYFIELWFFSILYIELNILGIPEKG